MKFKTFLKALNEGFGSFRYVLPKDKSKLLFDFYALTALQTPDHQDLRLSLEEAKETITKGIREEFLESLVFAMAAEFRHIFDFNSANEIKIFFDKFRAKQFIKDYALKYKVKMSSSISAFLERDRVRLTKEFKNNDVGYKDSFLALKSAAKKSKLTNSKLVSLMSAGFDKMSWGSSYGGKSWKLIADAWLKLNRTTKTNDLIVLIDHIYDLQHNTGSVFTKLKSYYKGGFGWIQDALDKKFKIKNLFEIFSDTSFQVRKLMPAILKNTTGQTLEDFLKDKKLLKKNTKTYAKFSKAGNTKVPAVNKLVKKVKGDQVWKETTWEGGTWKNGFWKNGTWEDGTWKKGTWKDGVWKKGIWKDGIWERGIWENGFWEAGTWKDGIWKDGIWEGGTWKNGFWKNGIWENGTWKKGTWEAGTWKDGIWEGGTWKNGFWKNGTWEDGTWKNGFWKNGTWEDGTWKKGTWEAGTWKDGIWEDGIWERGIWENGFWDDGIWKDGIWKDGFWQNGTWEGGTWEGGTWEGGFWKDGTWEDGTWKAGQIWDPKLKKFVQSKVSPKEYFKNKEK